MPQLLTHIRCVMDVVELVQQHMGNCYRVAAPVPSSICWLQ